MEVDEHFFTSQRKLHLRTPGGGGLPRGLVVKTPHSQCRGLGLTPAQGTRWASQVALVIKNPPANAGDIRGKGLIPGLGRSPGGGHGNPLQYSCLENSMDRGAWGATNHRVTQRWT